MNYKDAELKAEVYQSYTFICDCTCRYVILPTSKKQWTACQWCGSAVYSDKGKKQLFKKKLEEARKSLEEK